MPIADPDAALLESSISKIRDLPDPETWAANMGAGSAYSLQDALGEAVREG